MLVTYPFYADLFPLLGQQVEVLAEQQYEGKLISLHKSFAQIGDNLVWLDDILNVRSLSE